MAQEHDIVDVLYKGLTIINTLLGNAGRKVGRRDLADKTGLRPKQVGRYLNTLEEVYVPLNREVRGREELVWIGRDNGHRQARLLPFTSDELTALYFYASLSHYLHDDRLHAGLRAACEKIARALGEGVPHPVPSAQAFAPFAKHYKPYSTPQVQHVLALIMHALLASWPCRVTYQTPTARRAKRYVIHPYSLFEYDGGLYLFAYLPARDAVIMQSVERIRHLEVLEDTPCVKTPEVWRRLEAMRTRAFGILDDGEVQEVVLHFTPAQAPYVRERVWHPTQQFEEQRDGSLRMRFQASGGFEIVRWVLGWGDQVEVLAPPDLRQEVVRHVQDAAGQYAPPPTGSR